MGGINNSKERPAPSDNAEHGDADGNTGHITSLPHGVSRKRVGRLAGATVGVERCVQILE